MENRDKLHLKCKKYDDIIKATYIKYKNFCNMLLKKVKRDHEKQLLTNAAKTNNKTLWETVNKITHFKNKANPVTDLICSLNPISSINNTNHFLQLLVKI